MRRATCVVRRLVSLLLTLLGVTVVTFLIAQRVPTDAARLVAGEFASDESVARVSHNLGLDRPLIVQYGLYMQRLAHGDLGISVRSGRPVLDELLEVLPATVELALCAFTLILSGGIVFGSVAALYARRRVDVAIRLVSTLALSAPTFWTGLLFVWIFFGMLGWLPGNGRLDSRFDDVPVHSGLILIDALIARRFDMFGDALAHLALPAITLALASTGAAIRLIRTSLLEVLHEDYIYRVRAAGLSEWRILTRYALPNALIPFVTTAALFLGDLLAGAVVTEIIFGWPGLGSYTMQAIAGLDFPAIMGFTLLAALIYTLANLIVDVGYGLLDPRIAEGRS